MSKSSKSKDPNKGTNATDEAAKAGTSCKVPCTITSLTVATQPTNRNRLKIGAGEEVDLTVSPGTATWTATPSNLIELPAGAGSIASTTIRTKALDKAGNVTITAKTNQCECSITLTIVLPANMTMERIPHTNLIHRQGVPSCGWWGRPVITPNDVNFYNVCVRELNDLFIGTGAFATDNNKLHGASYYIRPDSSGEEASDWFYIDNYVSAKGSIFSLSDRIYGYAGAAKTSPSSTTFIAGQLKTKIRWQWTVNPPTTTLSHNFPSFEHLSISDTLGACTTSKGGHSETIANVNDPTSS